ncbi:hypothetical protein EI969_07455 [Pseudomonas sp. PB101]|uniref:SEC-C metal-binding domain-containing protein n=1 Tax=Pseudomonas sp. PB101 TaxID=2495428 RepID=UPI0013659894|nr:hypothetical protein [Pseudomonas sp. PB101]
MLRVMSSKNPAARDTSSTVADAFAWQLRAGLVQPRTRPGRNDPCYCGSGQKVKKCCKA